MIPLAAPIALAVLALVAWRYEARSWRAYEATFSEENSAPSAEYILQDGEPSWPSNKPNGQAKPTADAASKRITTSGTIVAVARLRKCRARPRTGNQPRLAFTHAGSALLRGTHLHVPGEGDGHKTKGTLSGQIIECITRALGIRVTPHQFRHLAAAFILANTPANYEFVRRVLGHKNLETTIRFYVGLETVDAVRKFSALALENDDWRPKR